MINLATYNPVPSLIRQLGFVRLNQVSYSLYWVTPNLWKIPLIAEKIQCQIWFLIKPVHKEEIMCSEFVNLNFQML